MTAAAFINNFHADFYSFRVFFPVKYFPGDVSVAKNYE
jgi:hypothetical protein